MSILIAIVGAIFAFLLVVVVHEYGHFIVARWMGIKVLRFSIGFGKPIYTHHAKSGVEFVVGWLPLGGYVKMQDAFSEGASPDAFENKPVLARMAVLVAGPLANLVLATFLFAVIFAIGFTEIKPIVAEVTQNSIAAKAGIQPGDQVIAVSNRATPGWQMVVMELIMRMGSENPVPVTVMSKQSQQVTVRQVHLQQWQFDPMKPNLLTSFGIQPYFPAIPPVVFSIMPNTPAAKSDLRSGDRIVAVNQLPIPSWQRLVEWIAAHPDQTVNIKIRRGELLKTISVKLGERDRHGFLGIVPKPVQIPSSLKVVLHYPWYATAVPALKETKRWVTFHLIVIKQLLLGRISLKTLSGPVAIFQTAGSASLAGLVVYLRFIALISVVLGVLNFLPIPALDGGHFLFCIIEGVIRRPIPARIQLLLIQAGVFFLISIMVYATLNDLMRMVQ